MINLFHHIPRTGGSSIARLMSTLLVESGGIFIRWNDPDNNFVYRNIIDQLSIEPVLVFSLSHFAAWVKPDPGYLSHHTFVRCPVARRVSGYLYNLSPYNQGPNHKEAVSQSCYDFTVNSTLDNEQFRYLMAPQGKDDHVYRGKIDQTIFDSLCRRLDKFSSVGTTERFTESFLQMTSLMGLNPGDLEIAQLNPDYPELLSPDQKHLMETNTDSWDIKLWNYAKQRSC